MCDIPVFYATTEGQTERIAERIAEHFRERGLSSEAISVGAPEAADVDWSRARAIVVGASLHGGRHQKEAARFIQMYRHRLNAGISAFFSVSLAAASTRLNEAEEARRIARTFVQQLGWHPSSLVCVAGRLAYTKYGLLKRWLMRAIARREGASTDTTRDHEYTDWQAVALFADRLVDSVRAGAVRLDVTASHRRAHSFSPFSS
jgi:menaquinone-dependent protoporphyrinogen oxidase